MGKAWSTARPWQHADDTADSPGGESAALSSGSPGAVRLIEPAALDEVRAVAVSSSTTRCFKPHPAKQARWEEAGTRLAQIMANTARK